MPCRLILNADDLGSSPGVNEAVCALYEAGIVTSTSLLVGAPAARDAVERVAARPGLAVGLHVALIHGHPVLPPSELPELTGGNGEFNDDCFRTGLRCTLSPACRREMARELRAQFKAFDALGFGWSHVDGHAHFTLTPAVFGAVLVECRRYPVAGLRVPQDDYPLYRRLDPADAARQRSMALHFALFCAWQRWELRRHPYMATRRCFGFFRSGRLDRDYLVRLVSELPDGDLELHCHPDVDTVAGRREFEALSSPEFRRALEKRGVVLTTYAGLAAARRPQLGSSRPPVVRDPP